ncbi:hypothetical protein RJ640_002718 [Escallonia rubra]|uniref:Uncharacterized protein n=1 Tax=Escallonia rubra TaxID=112253 RepID=A0AA88RKD5_9ASTE|nr:hypothetical protein RJ640_002718 [Escallonia rubra]
MKHIPTGRMVADPLTKLLLEMFFFLTLGVWDYIGLDMFLVVSHSNPISAYWNAGKRILRHLRGTADLILCYHGEDLRLRGVYIDADWGGDKDERRST